MPRAFVNVAPATALGPRQRAGAGVQGTFTYHTDGGSPLVAGMLVAVPFGARELAGVVTQVEVPQPDFETKAVARSLLPEPVLGQIGIDLAHFVSRTYRAPVFEAIRPMLPPGLAASLPRVLLESDWTPPRSRTDAEQSVGDVPTSRIQLTAEQTVAFNGIVDLASRRRGEGVLLEGVTGSGKTLIYQEAIAEIVGAGGQAIVLVSEIGLTPEVVARFKRRYAGRIVVAHSGLVPGVRYREWAAFASGEAKVAVGARSALFLSPSDLRLIVLDEEHDWSYKQDATPRYHARDVALELGRLSGAAVVLASATPDVVTSYRARSGALRRLVLSRRVRAPADTPGSRPLPPDSGLPAVEIVDLRKELAAGIRGVFSRSLTQALGETLDRGEQAILFINRRGTSTHTSCRACGYIRRCRRCDSALVFHRGTGVESDAPGATAGQETVGGELRCHSCGRREPMSARCPSCGRLAVRQFGVGTERIEAELKRQFPGARVGRWDRDATRAGRGDASLWRSFRNRELDVLVGTQLVTKGLDFPNVTLVGVILADVGLFLPDFRAAERTFQLLTQVVGRAGRAARPGLALIQTYVPDHEIVVAAAAHDYESFYQRELKFRAEHGYPPFGRLVRFLYAGSSDLRSEREAARLRESLKQRFEELGDTELRMIGPAPCYHRRVRGKYRWHILARGTVIEPLLEGLVLPPGWIIDVDPVSLL